MMNTRPLGHFQSLQPRPPLGQALQLGQSIDSIGEAFPNLQLLPDESFSPSFGFADQAIPIPTNNVPEGETSPNLQLLLDESSPAAGEVAPEQSASGANSLTVGQEETEARGNVLPENALIEVNHDSTSREQETSVETEAFSRRINRKPLGGLEPLVVFNLPPLGKEKSVGTIDGVDDTEEPLSNGESLSLETASELPEIIQRRSIDTVPSELTLPTASSSQPSEVTNESQAESGSGFVSDSPVTSSPVDEILSTAINSQPELETFSPIASPNSSFSSSSTPASLQLRAESDDEESILPGDTTNSIELPNSIEPEGNTQGISAKPSVSGSAQPSETRAIKWSESLEANTSDSTIQPRLEKPHPFQEQEPALGVAVSETPTTVAAAINPPSTVTSPPPSLTTSSFASPPPIQMQTDLQGGSSSELAQGSTLDSTRLVDIASETTPASQQADPEPIVPTDLPASQIQSESIQPDKADIQARLEPEATALPSNSSPSEITLTPANQPEIQFKSEAISTGQPELSQPLLSEAYPSEPSPTPVPESSEPAASDYPTRVVDEITPSSHPILSTSIDPTSISSTSQDSTPIPAVATESALVQATPQQQADSVGMSSLQTPIVQTDRIEPAADSPGFSTQSTQQAATQPSSTTIQLESRTPPQSERGMEADLLPNPDSDCRIWVSPQGAGNGPVRDSKSNVLEETGEAQPPLDAEITSPINSIQQKTPDLIQRQTINSAGETQIQADTTQETVTSEELLVSGDETPTSVKDTRQTQQSQSTELQLLETTVVQLRSDSESVAPQLIIPENSLLEAQTTAQQPANLEETESSESAADQKTYGITSLTSKAEAVSSDASIWAQVDASRSETNTIQPKTDADLPQRSQTTQDPGDQPPVEETTSAFHTKIPDDIQNLSEPNIVSPGTEAIATTSNPSEIQLRSTGSEPTNNVEGRSKDATAQDIPGDEQIQSVQRSSELLETSSQLQTLNSSETDPGFPRLDEAQSDKNQGQMGAEAQFSDEDSSSTDKYSSPSSVAKEPISEKLAPSIGLPEGIQKLSASLSEYFEVATSEVSELTLKSEPNKANLSCVENSIEVQRSIAPLPDLDSAGFSPSDLEKPTSVDSAAPVNSSGVDNLVKIQRSIVPLPITDSVDSDPSNSAEAISVTNINTVDSSALANAIGVQRSASLPIPDSVNPLASSDTSNSIEPSPVSDIVDSAKEIKLPATDITEAVIQRRGLTEAESFVSDQLSNHSEVAEPNIAEVQAKILPTDAAVSPVEQLITSFEAIQAAFKSEEVPFQTDINQVGVQAAAALPAIERSLPITQPPESGTQIQPTLPSNPLGSEIKLSTQPDSIAPSVASTDEVLQTQSTVGAIESGNLNLSRIPLGHTGLLGRSMPSASILKNLPEVLKRTALFDSFIPGFTLFSNALQSQFNVLTQEPLEVRSSQLPNPVNQNTALQNFNPTNQASRRQSDDSNNNVDINSLLSLAEVTQSPTSLNQDPALQTNLINQKNNLPKGIDLDSLLEISKDPGDSKSSLDKLYDFSHSYQKAPDDVRGALPLESTSPSETISISPAPATPPLSPVISPAANQTASKDPFSTAQIDETLDLLARKIYPLLQQQLDSDRDRAGIAQTRHLSWYCFDPSALRHSEATSVAKSPSSTDDRSPSDSLLNAKLNQLVGEVYRTLRQRLQNDRERFS
jgi:hypothetical protein